MCVVFVLLERICIITKEKYEEKKRICIAFLHLAVCRLVLLHHNKTYLNAPDAFFFSEKFFDLDGPICFTAKGSPW